MTGKDREKQAITMTSAPALHFSTMIADKMQQAARNGLQLSGLFMCRHRRCRKWFDLQISLMLSLRIRHHQQQQHPPPTPQVVSWGKQMTDVERQTGKRVTREAANEFQHIASVLGDGEKHFSSFRRL